MATTTLELAQARTALASASARAAGLISSLPDLSVRAAHCEWTVGQVAAHLVSGLQGFTEAATGQALRRHDLIPDAARYPERLARWARPDGSSGCTPRRSIYPERMARLNQATIAAEPRRSPADAARAITDAAAAYLSATACCSASDPIATPWYGEGRSHTVQSATCLLVGEQLIHGYDVARGVGRKWTITPEESYVVFEAVQAMMPMIVNPDASRDLVATYRLHVGRRSGFVVRVADGQATVNPATPSPIDCHIAGTPMALLLVGYGRMSQWRAIATGRLIAWGRRPWLGLRFVHLFFNP